MSQSNQFNAQNHLDAITRDGYCIVENVIEPNLIKEITEHIESLEAEGKLPLCQNNFEGFRTARLFNLLKYDSIFDQIPINDKLLSIAEGVLDDGLLLSSIGAMMIHPGETAQPIHADTQLINLPRPHIPISLSCMLAISDYTAGNGTTRLLPRSHLRPEAPSYGLEVPEAIPIEFSAGSALFFNSQIWHGGGANQSTKPRVGVVLAYCAGWMRPQENTMLGLSQERTRELPRRLQELLGYGIYKGQWGHIEKHDPIQLLGISAGQGMVWDASERAISRESNSSKEVGKPGLA